MAELERQLQQFDGLIKRIGFLGESRLKDRILKRWAKEVDSLIVQGFDSSTDPYGKKWKKLKRDYGPRKGGPLYKTGELRRSYQVRAAGDGLNIKSSVDYSGFHQDGTVNMFARKMIPGAAGLGKWREPLVKAAQEVIKAAFVK